MFTCDILLSVSTEPHEVATLSTSSVRMLHYLLGTWKEKGCHSVLDEPPNNVQNTKGLPLEGPRKFDLGEGHFWRRLMVWCGGFLPEQLGGEKRAYPLKPRESRPLRVLAQVSSSVSGHKGKCWTYGLKRSQWSPEKVLPFRRRTCECISGELAHCIYLNHLKVTGDQLPSQELQGRVPMLEKLQGAFKCT